MTKVRWILQRRDPESQGRIFYSVRDLGESRKIGDKRSRGPSPQSTTPECDGGRPRGSRTLQTTRPSFKNPSKEG